MNCTCHDCRSDRHTWRLMIDERRQQRLDREYVDAGLPEFHGHDWARDLDWQDILVASLATRSSSSDEVDEVQP